MTSNDFSSRIEDGEKFAFVGLSGNVDAHLPQGQIARDLWVFTGTKFSFPPHWRGWIGSIRADELESCNLFLLSKLPSLTPKVLDDENQKLERCAWNFYVGLLLASTFAPAERPIMLTGVRQNGEIVVRRQKRFDLPVPCIIHRYPPVVPDDIRQAAHLGEMLGAMAEDPPDGGLWRLNRVISLYRETRARGDVLDRLHQYSRCVDGLILPDAGKTRQQFKSRTELLIGPRHHDLMGEIYDARSAVEHLHENRYLEDFDRAVRLDLLRKVVIVDHIARSSLARIVGSPALWPYFANTAALGRFWGLSAADRQRIWGEPIDPLEAVAEFDPERIHDGLLGGP